MFGRGALFLLTACVLTGCDREGGLFGRPPTGPVAKIWHVKPGGTGDGSSWDSAVAHPQYAMDDASEGDEIWVAGATYASPGPRTTTFLNDSFEGPFPGSGWRVEGDPSWDVTSYRSATGGQSVYCCGTAVAAPGPHWPEMYAQMIYGPFDLSNASSGSITFETWLNTQAGFDGVFWAFSTDGDQYDAVGGASGDESASGWVPRNIDLTNAPPLGDLRGQSQVWFALWFLSDSGTEYEGAYVDDVVIQKTTDYGQPVVLAMKDGVSVYGGFAGTETSRNERDWAANEVILDGEDTCLHVVVGASEARLDGFTVTRGNANGSGPGRCGAGMYIADVSPTVANCRFLGNSALDSGGGIYSVWGSPVITNCVFYGNQAGNAGGGIFQGNANGTTRVVNCTFNGNIGTGGAVRLDAASGDIFIDNCILWGDSLPELSQMSGGAGMNHSCYQGGWFGTGVGNIDADPLFVDPAGGDLRLAEGSPCIDAADGDKAPATDIDGNRRYDDPYTQDTGRGSPSCADMGAHEYPGVVPRTWYVKVGGTGDGSSWANAMGGPQYAADAASPGDEVWVAEGTYTRVGPRTVTVLSETFEREFPGTTWDIRDDPSWATTNYRAASDGRSAYCCGTNVSPPGPYSPGMYARMVYGPFDLSDATAGNMTFRYWLNSQQDCDYLKWMVSLDDDWYYGWVISGNLGGWNTDSLDLANVFTLGNVCGQPQVWFAIFFESDASIEYEGAYVDDVVIQKTTASGDTFVLAMKDGVSIYGGFAGTESSLGERDLSVHETILDGEGLCWHVVVGANDGVLDGFTITGGNANGGAVDGIDHDGAGMCNNYVSNVTVANCRFYGNSAFDDGGGIYNNYSSPTITNCTFRGNWAAWGGGGVDNWDSPQGVIANCTFWGNTAVLDGGGLRVESGSSPTITNCIFWGNSAPTGPQVGGSAGPAVVTYSCIQGGWSGVGNTSGDPLFVDAAGGDLHLQWLSPCIDTGTPSGAPSTDIEGIIRPQGSGIDMGAYEYRP